MIDHMKLMSRQLHNILQNNCAKLNLMDCNVDNPFNHCTVLLYYADDNDDISSSMGDHSDYTYRPDNRKFNST